MRWSLRVSLVVFSGSFGCVGGPVSDWPSKNHDDPDVVIGDPTDESAPAPQTPGRGSTAGAMDGGVPTSSPPASSPETDAEGSTSRDGGTQCDSDAGACRAACSDGDASVVLEPTGRARLGCARDPAISD